MNGQTVQVRTSPEDLNPIELQIIKVLLEHGTFETTTYYADKANISWNTAFAYLKLFKKSGWIFHVKKGNRDFWKAQAEN